MSCESQTLTTTTTDVATGKTAEVNEKQFASYCLYQMTCGFDGDQAKFKKKLFELLNEYYAKSGVCVTANSILFSESMWPGKFPCEGEPVAMVFLSVNPKRNPEDAAPHVKWLGTQLAINYSQFVVPCYGVSQATTVFACRKDDLEK